MQRMTSGVKIARSLACVTTLSDGVQMPLFGLGTYLSESGGVTERAVIDAIKMGYRLIDTAVFYGNEADVGRGVKNCGLPRDQIFVVTKLLWDDHGAEKTGKGIKESLKQLDLGYIDLLLIHTPRGGKLLETYDEMLKAKEQGLVRSVGVSNFGIQHLEGLKKAGRPTPSVNQIELHAWQPRTDLVNYCRENGITVMGYSPLGKGKKLDDPQVTALADKYKKSYAQILIRWCVQKGIIIIPKSTNKERIQQNGESLEFSISDEDMALMDAVSSWTCMSNGWKPQDLAESTWEELA